MYIKQSRKGFTLAEMLVVVFIVSILAAASLPLLTKKHTKKLPTAIHGRYECYYDADGVLTERKFDSGVIIPTSSGPAPGGVCTFTPPKGAAFFIVQAIGGGGAGSDVGIPERYSDSDPQYIWLPARSLPWWLADNEAEFEANAGNITITGRSASGRGGEAFKTGTKYDGNYTGLDADACLGSPPVTDGDGTHYPALCSTYFQPQCGSAVALLPLMANQGGDGGNGYSGSLTAPILGPSKNQIIEYSSSGLRIDGESCTFTAGKDGENADENGSGADGEMGTTTGSCNQQQSPGGAGGYYTMNGCNGPRLTRGANPTYGTADRNPMYKTATYSYTYKNFPYGKGGKAGEFKQIFLPTLSNTSLAITIGIGGQSDSAGGGSTSIGNILIAKGGIGGAIGGGTARRDLPTADGSELGTAGEASSWAVFNDMTTAVLPASDYGKGGQGGGSWTTCLTTDRTGVFGSYTEIIPPGQDCSDTDVDKNGSYPSDPGVSGAVVIIW